jgi:Uma2 family endonuclease
VPTTTQTITAIQLAALPRDGKRYELIDGELRMMSPAGNVHGSVAMRLGGSLWNHVRASHLGEVYAAETGFLLRSDPDTVRAADVAFVSRERLAGPSHTSGYLPLAPDLVGEVVSPSDTSTEVEEKAMAWLDAGSRMVLVVDPGTRTVRVYRGDSRITVLREGETLDAGEVVPGWQLTVSELFS